MDTTQQHTENALVLTSEQVDAILAAHRALSQLETNATRAGWDAPAGYVSMDTANSHDYGRIAGLAVAADAILFDVLNNALHHAKQTTARDGIDRWNGDND